MASCPGADYCSLAVSRSMGVAAAIRSHLLATNGQVEELGVFRIRISGCPNSCGQHHVGDIGLTGLSLKGDDGQDHPHYSMLVGGRVGEGTAAVGQRLTGRFPEAEVPKVIGALAEYYRRERQRGERFGDFVDRVGTDRLVGGGARRGRRGALTMTRARRAVRRRTHANLLDKFYRGTVLKLSRGAERGTIRSASGRNIPSCFST